MSLHLNRGSKPDGLEAKTFGLHGDFTVFIGEYELSMEDLFILTHYVLTNGDLQKDDPRRQFIDCIRSMREVEGHNAAISRMTGLTQGLFGVHDPNGKRLHSDVPPVVDKP